MVFVRLLILKEALAHQHLVNSNLPDTLHRHLHGNNRTHPHRGINSLHLHPINRDRGCNRGGGWV
jgi:hypothetical protein